MEDLNNLQGKITAKIEQRLLDGGMGFWTTHDLFWWFDEFTSQKFKGNYDNCIFCYEQMEFMLSEGRSIEEKLNRIEIVHEYRMNKITY